MTTTKRGRPPKTNSTATQEHIAADDVLIPVTSAYITDLTDWLMTAIKQVSHGTVGLQMSIHQNYVVGYEMIYKKTLKPTNYMKAKNNSNNFDEGT